ncbi:MAG TPA: hypothetical protein VKP08_21930, partial [Anaerolineales bacterium]|nr:hypothetical protein [Anaerolineales bacterium]
MPKYARFVVLSSMLLFMLLFGLACPVAVSADDGGPTPPATEEPVQPPAGTEEPVVTEEPAATEPAVITTEEPIVVEATPSPTVEPVEESGAESSPDEDNSVDELLQAAGEGTEIVVLDENNKALPLASKQAVAVVTAVGPIWCPAGVQPGGAGCTAQFASPQDLIDDMAANPANYDGDGIIYFTVDSGGAFVLAPGSGALDGADFDTIRGSNLTLQGGWSGKNGDTSFAQTSFGANAVQIGDDTNPWAGNITIKNITIN